MNGGLQIIFKYRAEADRDVLIPWGAGTRVTGAEADAAGLTFWCVHVGIPAGTRLVAVVGTGHPFPASNDVLATSRDRDTQLVWHLTAEPFCEDL